MKRYVFGVRWSDLPGDLTARIAATPANGLAALLDELLSAAGPHVLPHLRGDPSGLAAVRERFLRNLYLAFPREYLVASLRAEVLLLQKIAAAEAETELRRALAPESAGAEGPGLGDE